MEWKITVEGKEEIVALERWGWSAIYQDGTELMQFDPFGGFHRFAEIDQSKLKMFVMYRTNNARVRVDIPIRPAAMQIFHKYRNMVLDRGGPNERTARIYMFGWKDRTTGSETFMYILPDDRIIVSSKDDVRLTEHDI